MNLAIAAFITIIIGILNPTHSFWLPFLCFVAGGFFVVLHTVLVAPGHDEPIGIAYLIVVLAGLIGVMLHNVAIMLQLSALFLAGALFYATISDLRAQAKVS